MEEKMKSIFTLILCIFALAFVGCGGDDNDDTTAEAGTAGEGGAAGEGGEAGEGEGGEAGEGEGGEAGEGEGGEAGEAETADIIDTATAAGDFTLLAAALEAGGLTDTLRGEGPFTVFAPNDAAITATLEALGLTVEDFVERDDLQQILLYHVVSGAAVASTDLEAVQVVSTAATTGEDGPNLSAVITAGDEGVSINAAATVTTADITASNGVIHVIDTVLLPANIVNLASAYPDFTTLVAAAGAADLVTTLTSPGPFTIFAPTDAAFEAAIEALGTTAEDLLANPDLAGILTYHGLAGIVLAADIAAGETTVTTLAEIDVTINNTDDGVTIGGANVVMTDIVGTNGVIHVIDAVLLPPAGDDTTDDAADADAEAGGADNG